MFDFVEGFRFCFKDFSKIGILFDPIGESPCNKTKISVSVNLVDVSDLVVIKVKGVL